MKRTGFLLAALVLLIALCGLSGAACAESVNPHAAEWPDEAMTASPDTLMRIDA